MNEQPDISVIIAAYNVAPYIARAIRSGLDQASVSVEIIVADDGSTDDTLAAAYAVDDARLTILPLPKNSGPSVARNACIAAARGSWIAVLDGDDMFLPGRLARCLTTASKARADIVVDNLLVRPEASGSAFPMFPPRAFGASRIIRLDEYIAKNMAFLGGYTWGYLKPIFSAAFLKEHALFYDPGLRIGEDFQLMAKALAKGAMCAVEPTAGYSYTIRAGSISHRIAAADVRAMADASFLQRHSLTAKTQALIEKRQQCMHNAIAFSDLVEALKRQDWATALKTMAACPVAALHLWRPLWARLKRCSSPLILPKRNLK